MAFAKRIFLFLLLNFVVVFTIGIILRIFNIQPYLQAHGLNYGSLAAFCLIWGMGGALISLALSRQMAKWMMGLKVINPATHDLQERQLLEMVYRLARKANLPAMPEVAFYQSKEANAFATGPSRRRSLVAVSSGLYNRMSEKEIEGVIGHEISHIANGDMVTMTLLQGVVNAFVLFLARVLAFALSGMGKDREKNSGLSFYLFTYLFEVIFMILGSLVIAAYSRYREFRADAGGAKLAGKESMVSALQSLRALQEIRDPHEKPAMAAFKISHPGKKGFLHLFATHPPLEERIARLNAL